MKDEISYSLNGESFQSLKWKIEFCNKICSIMGLEPCDEYYIDELNQEILIEGNNGDIKTIKIKIK